MSENYLIIGGDGFLGRWIVDFLIKRKSESGLPLKHSISVFDLQQRYFDDGETVTYYTGDIANYQDISNAIKNSSATVVIHCASPPFGLSVDVYQKVNVVGTKNVIKACVEFGVEKLVYTSSAAVVHDGVSDLINVDETTPHPEKFDDFYYETKAEAEKLVLAANSNNGLLTCALRPSGIFGPGDRQMIPGFIQVMENGKSKFQVGNNFNLFDWTYVENIANAHLLAAEKLAKGSGIDGEVFFITNDSPTPFWDLPRFIWGQFNHYPPYYIKMPRSIGMALAYFSEWSSYLLKKEDVFTRKRVRFACSNRYFNITKAKTVLGYKPIVDLEEGTRRAIKYFIEQRQNAI